MVISIPYAFQGAIYALIVSRESSQATFKSACVDSHYGLGGAYILASPGSSSAYQTCILSLGHSFIFSGIYCDQFTIKNFGVQFHLRDHDFAGVLFLWDRHVSAETMSKIPPPPVAPLPLPSAIGSRGYSRTDRNLFSRIQSRRGLVGASRTDLPPSARVC